MSRLRGGWVLAVAILWPLGGAAQQAPPVEAGAVGEPAFWEVTGVSAGDTLNLRGGPSTADPIVAELARGTVLRNLGCTEQDEQRWCEVEVSEGGLRGWASGRYLIEHIEVPESATAAAAESPAADTIPPTGTVFCSLNDGANQSCPFVARGLEDGGTEVVVTFPDGFERILDFRGGEVFSPDPTDEVSFSRGDGKTVVEVNGVERIEVPDAAVPAS